MVNSNVNAISANESLLITRKGEFKLRRLVLVLSIFALCLLPSSAFAEVTTPTNPPADTTPTTTPAPVTTAPDLDADLPGATTVPPSGPTKEETVAQENAKKANSKLDKVTKKLLDAQLAADLTSQEIQTTKATLLDLQDKIAKNEALLAVRELPLNQLSKIVKKRAVTMYQDSNGAPTNAIDQFYYNRQNALSSTAQRSNVEDFKSFLKQQDELETLKNSLSTQKADAELKQAQLEELSIEFGKQLEDAKKEYEKTATLFLDANAAIGARLAINGKMCPIAGPMTHVDDWGNPRSGGRTHKGNDLFNAMGTPNVAIVDGTISHTSGGLGGTGVMLAGIDGNVYYYAHLSAYAGPPRAVKQGDVIGYTGDTGNAQGGAPHTHFEIRIGGTMHTNPYPLLRIICGV